MAGKAKRKSSSLEVEVARLDERVNALDKLHMDVKSVLEIVGKLELGLAKIPTWDDLNKTNRIVEDLVADKNQSKGSWKTVAVVASVVSGVVGWLSSYLATSPNVPKLHP